MPEFVMPIGSSPYWERLDAFTKGFWEAAFFTECHSDNPELEDATFADVADSSLKQAHDDCCAFQYANADLLEEAYASGNYSEEQAGRDYWFTRNGHGVGYWDRASLKPSCEAYEALTAEMVANKGNPDAWGRALAKRKELEAASLGAQLSTAAQKAGEINLYRGDDGRVYLD